MSYSPGKWNDIILPVTGLGNGVVVPAMTNVIGNVSTYGFATGDFFYGAFEIPHNYKEGSDLDVHIHWAPSSTNTGDCVWAFEYTIANKNGTFGATAILAATQAGSGTALKHQYLEFSPTITGTSIKVGAIIMYRLLRNAVGDTFTGTALGCSLGIHYQCDSIGSNAETTKN